MIGKTIEPHKEVSIKPMASIEEVSSVYGLTKSEGQMIYRLRDKNCFYICDLFSYKAEKTIQGRIAQKLFTKGYINYVEDELTSKARLFITAVNARMETRLAVYSGTDLFPLMANIKEFKN